MAPWNKAGGALLTLLLSLAPNAVAETPHKAEFAHDGGWDAGGNVAGTCTLAGVAFSPLTPIRLTLSSAGGSLTVYETWYNLTIFHKPVPAALKTSENQYARSYNVPAGPLQVGWDEKGHGALLPADWGGAGGLRAIWASSSATFGAPVDRVASGLQYPTRVGPVLAWVHYDGMGPARALETTNRSLGLAGDLLLLLDGARLDAVGFHHELPPFQVTVQATRTPAVTIETVRYTHALLRLRDVQGEVPTAGASSFCREAQVRVEGTAHFRHAAGALSGRQAHVAFENRDLTLQGAFDVEESLRPRTGQANGFSGESVGAFAETRAAGEFVAVGLDFAPVTTWQPEAWQVAAGVGLLAILLGALAWAANLWSRLIGFFFSRMTPGRVLAHPTRSAIVEAVARQPGAILRDLVVITGRPYAVVRHHARLLQDEGQVKLLRRGRALHVYPPEVSLGVARRRLALDSDAPVRRVVERLVEGDRSLRQVVAELRVAFGFSRMGAWKAVRRAERAGLVERVLGAPEVRLRARPA